MTKLDILLSAGFGIAAAHEILTRYTSRVGMGNYTDDQKRSLQSRYLACPSFWMSEEKIKALDSDAQTDLKSLPPGVHQYQFHFFVYGKPTTFKYNMNYGEDSNRNIDLRIAFQKWRTGFDEKYQAKLDDTAFDIPRDPSPPLKYSVTSIDKNGNKQMYYTSSKFAAKVMKWYFGDKD
jgi:hypothetical protein